MQVTGVYSRLMLSDQYGHTRIFGRALYDPNASANLAFFHAFKDIYYRSYSMTLIVILSSSRPARIPDCS